MHSRNPHPPTPPPPRTPQTRTHQKPQRLLRLGASAGSTRGALDIQRAIILTASVKTLPVAVAVFAALAPALGGRIGVALVPAVMAHLSQILIDSTIVAHWRRQERPEVPRHQGWRVRGDRCRHRRRLYSWTGLNAALNVFANEGSGVATKHNERRHTGKMNQQPSTGSPTANLLI